MYAKIEYKTYFSSTIWRTSNGRRHLVYDGCSQHVFFKSVQYRTFFFVCLLGPQNASPVTPNFDLLARSYEVTCQRYALVLQQIQLTDKIYQRWSKLFQLLNSFKRSICWIWHDIYTSGSRGAHPARAPPNGRGPIIFLCTKRYFFSIFPRSLRSRII